MMYVLCPSILQAIFWEFCVKFTKQRFELPGQGTISDDDTAQNL